MECSSLFSPWHHTAHCCFSGSCTHRMSEVRWHHTWRKGDSQRLCQWRIIWSLRRCQALGYQIGCLGLQESRILARDTTRASLPSPCSSPRSDLTWRPRWPPLYTSCLSRDRQWWPFDRQCFSGQWSTGTYASFRERPSLYVIRLLGLILPSK